MTLWTFVLFSSIFAFAAADVVVVGNSTLNIAPLGAPRLLVSDAATLQRLKTAATSKTAAYTRFKSVCDDQVSSPDIYFDDWNVALLTQVLNQTSYCTYAVARSDDFVASEMAIINNNQVPVVAGDSYLEIGGYVGGLMIIYDWCRPQMSEAQRSQWRNYSNLAVSNVWNQTYAKWGNTTYPGSNWAVNDPSNNYYYSFLRATMLLGLATYGENPQAQRWLTQFRVTKLQNQLVPEFTTNLVGGGSREGTGYGTAMRGLFDLYFWWEKSTGERIADLTPHTLASLDKLMHDIQPTFDYISIVGDQARESTGAFFDYHREYLLIASALYPNDQMAGIAKTLLQQSTLPEMTYRFEIWIDYVYSNDVITAKPLNLMASAHWGSGTGQFTTRSSWTDQLATWANFICGPYTQSHAHQDQLSFMIYKGALLASDETYDSHSGLRQEEEAHNLVRIIKNNVQINMPVESNPCVMKALIDTDSYAYAFGDVTQMFNNPSIVKLQREFVFIKPGTFVILDRVDTSGTNIKRVWTLNMHNLPTVSNPNIVVQNTNVGTHTLNVIRLSPATVNYTIVDWSTLHPDGDNLGGYRVDETDLSTGSSTVFLHVLGADNAFASAVSSNAPGLTGTLITFAGGSTALVRFNTTGTGGTITLTNANGTVVESHPLPTTIVTPPRFVTPTSTTSTTGQAATTTTSAKASTTTTSTTGKAATTTTTSAKASTTTTTSTIASPTTTGCNCVCPQV